MAANLGVIATLTQAGGLDSSQAHAFSDARVKTFLDYYVLAGTEGSGDTFDFFKTLRAGMRVIAIMLTVSTAQTSLTISIGDDASATRYASADTSLQSAGTYWFSGLTGATGFYEIGTNTNDEQILLTTGGATATAGNLAGAILVALD